MKKILLVLALLMSSTAFAQHGHYGHHGYWRHGGDGRWFWMAPLVIGGAVVYEVTRPNVVYQQPPVIVQQPPVITPNTVVIDGVAYTKQVMVINGVQQEVLVRQ